MQYLNLALKLLVVPIALWVLAAQLGRDARLGSIAVDGWMLAAALLVNQAALTLFAARMRSAMRVFGIALGIRHALRIHLQSVFYFFVLPMTVGMEVARFMKIRSLLGDEARATPLTYALLADRLLGAAAALAIALTLLPFIRFQAIHWDSSERWVLWLFLGAVAVAMLLLHSRARGHAADLLALLGSGHRSLWNPFAISLLTHVCFAFGIYLAARGAGVAIEPLQAIFAISGAMLFVVLPISFAGVSPVEAANLGVLLAMGIPVEQAGLFAFFVYLAKLVAAVEGAAWEILEGGAGFLQLAKKRPEGGDSR